MEYFIAKPVDTGILDSDYIRSDVCLRHIRNARFEVWMVMGGVLFVLTVLTLILTIICFAVLSRPCFAGAPLCYARTRKVLKDSTTSSKPLMLLDRGQEVPKELVRASMPVLCMPKFW